MTAISKLKDALEQRDRRIEKLRAEVDELRELVERMNYHVENANSIIERSRELIEDPFWDWDLLEDYRAKYDALVRDWNAVVPLIRHQPVGRPLAASPAQAADVHTLRKAGRSLRGIAEETSLGLNTVRTIVDGKRNGRTMRRWRAIEPDSAREWQGQKRKKRAIEALPKQAQHVVEQGQALLKEAKGIGRGL